MINLDDIGHGGRKCELEMQTSYVWLTQTKLGNILKSGSKLKVIASSKNPLPQSASFHLSAAAAAAAAPSNFSAWDSGTQNRGATSAPEATVYFVRVIMESQY
ncbi:hypothetical protein VNO80_26451 [Phaseolus coccineus]|uniref:Uncharacterized protein n=1 Tax=Phaseolus coccineus TaxID=3886 RepID=A0AAN9LES8_PHACN